MKPIDERLLDSDEYAGTDAIPPVAYAALAEVRSLRAEVATLAEDRGALVRALIGPPFCFHDGVGVVDREFGNDSDVFPLFRIDDELVEKIEREVGMGAGAWDTVKPEQLIAAVLKWHHIELHRNGDFTIEGSLTKPSDEATPTLYGHDLGLAAMQKGVPSRADAARFAEKLMPDMRLPFPPEHMETIGERKGCRFHFGKVELRDLFDFIYGGPPESDDEKLFQKGGAV